MRHSSILRALLAATCAAAAIAVPSSARADRVVVRLGGSLHIGAGVTVRVGRHRAPPPPPVVYADGYDVACDHPVDPYYAPTPPPAPAPPPPAITYTASPRPRRAMIGLGLYASSLQLGEDGPEGEGVGAILRVRSLRGPLEVELEAGRDTFLDGSRVDTRLGASLLLNVSRHGALTPYLLVGAGVNVMELDTREERPRQLYLEAGGGLAWQLGERLVVAGDLRWQARRLDAEDPDPLYQKAIVGLPEEERVLTGRLSGILYF